MPADTPVPRACPGAPSRVATLPWRDYPWYREFCCPRCQAILPLEEHCPCRVGMGCHEVLRWIVRGAVRIVHGRAAPEDGKDANNER